MARSVSQKKDQITIVQKNTTFFQYLNESDSQSIKKCNSDHGTLIPKGKKTKFLGVGTFYCHVDDWCAKIVTQ